MRARRWSFSVLLLMALAAVIVRPQEKGGQEEFGPYEPVPNWPQPLPDGPDGVKHDGWTWGSVGAVFAETPDRIWIAQRGELPLPKGAAPSTETGTSDPVVPVGEANPRSRRRLDAHRRRRPNHGGQCVRVEPRLAKFPDRSRRAEDAAGPPSISRRPLEEYHRPSAHRQSRCQDRPGRAAAHDRDVDGHARIAAIA